MIIKAMNLDMLALVESLNKYCYKTFNMLKGFLYPLAMSKRCNIHALTCTKTSI